MGFLGGSVVENLSASAAGAVSFPGVGSLLEEEMATHSILPGKFNGERGASQDPVDGVTEKSDTT